MKKIKIEINLKNNWTYFIVFLFLFIFVSFIVYAYNSNMRVGNPTLMGHSAGEIHINYNGQTVNLQSFVDDISQKINSRNIEINYDLIWSGRVTKNGEEINLLPGKRISNYDEVLFLTEDGNFGRVPVKLMYDLRNSNLTYFDPTNIYNLWKEESFSGDDSGSFSITYINDTRIRVGTFRIGKNALVALYGLNFN